MHTSIIVVEWKIKRGNSPPKEVKRFINLFEHIGQRAAAVTVFFSDGDEYFMSFFPQLKQEEYFISNISLQIEFVESNIMQA